MLRLLRLRLLAAVLGSGLTSAGAPACRAGGAGADASSQAGAGPTAAESQGSCVLLCANLSAQGCHPTASCENACEEGILLKLVSPAQVACAGTARGAAAVAACGGGFCRVGEAGP